MPELPEVEVVKKSLEKQIKEKTVKKVIVKNRNLRKKIPVNFESFFHVLKKQKLCGICFNWKVLLNHHLTKL